MFTENKTYSKNVVHLGASMLELGQSQAVVSSFPCKSLKVLWVPAAAVQVTTFIVMQYMEVKIFVLLYRCSMCQKTQNFMWI
jgi:hypothetical protein